jgi:periplasmic protein TonB
MAAHTDILDQHESLGKPFIQSALFHAAVFGLLIFSSIRYASNRETFGSATTRAGDIVTVHPSSTIPLPSHPGRVNPVANPTESIVPQFPKPEPKKQIKAPLPDAIPLHSRFPDKPSPHDTSPQRYQPAPMPPNQVPSHEAPAANNPMFQKVGAGGVGMGTNSVFGTRFGAYADRVIQLVSEKWQTNGLGGLHAAPTAIITFDIQRDGSVRNVQIAQRSGNGTLDASAQRAVLDAAPFPPLPPGYDKNEANVELRFQLQR